MSGLYNMLMGRNPFSPLLLGVLNITQETQDKYPLGRIRDVWISDDLKTIKVLHRNYGEDGAKVNGMMEKNPNFVRHEVCDDETYQYWVFSVPTRYHGEPFVHNLRILMEDTDRMEPMDRYLKAIDDLKDGKENQQTKHMVEVGKDIVAKILNQEDGIVGNENGSVVIENINLDDEDET